MPADLNELKKRLPKSPLQSNKRLIKSNRKQLLEVIAATET